MAHFWGENQCRKPGIKITQYIPKCVLLSYMVIIWGRIPSWVMRDSLHWVEKNPFIKMRVAISFHRKLPVFWPWYVLSSNTSWLWFPIFKYFWSKFKSLEVLLQKRLQPLTLSGLCGKTQWIDQQVMKRNRWAVSKLNNQCLLPKIVVENYIWCPWILVNQAYKSWGFFFTTLSLLVKN